MPLNPLILAFDTSAAHCAAALLLGDQIVAQTYENMTKGQAERLFPLLQDLLHQAGKDWPDLDAIGVCTGPGNFTGVRISVASARGLALSLKIPAVGISKLEAMAYGTKGSSLSVLDARRGRFYVQSFSNATPQDAPQMIAELDMIERADKAEIIHTSGEDIAALTGNTKDSAGQIVSAVAQLTAQRFATTTDRPAPLYLRAPDAAPAKDAGVPMLT